MNSISQYLIAVFELVEAEGRELKSQIISLFSSIAFLILFVFFFIASYALFMFGMYEYLTQTLTSYESAFILSGITFVISFITLGMVKWLR